jgi:hypothetical protein
MNGTSSGEQWYKDLDISLKGQPVGIEQIDKILLKGSCYCIVSQDGVIDRVDMYKDGQRIHYKKFGYDNLGRVIENTMYSPDDNGNWHVADDIWYYEYHQKTGLRTKKIMRMPGSSTVREISYDGQGNRTSETVTTVDS